jgi:hypothetical protein
MIKRIFTTLALAVIFSTSAMADKPVLDVLVNGGKSGTNMAQSTLLNQSLIEAGYDSQLVWTKNCPTTKEYISKNSRPAVFLYSDNRYVKDKVKGCDFSISDESFATLWNVKLHAFCVRSDSGFTDIQSFVKGKSKVTIATTNSIPGNPYADLKIPNVFGVEFKRVDYDGLKKTIAGLLAGDTDMMYQQYTATQANSKEMTCFSSSSTKEVNGMAPMTTVFPNWKMNQYNGYQYVHATNMSAADTKRVGAVISNLQISNAKLAEYLKKGYMMSAAEAAEQGLGRESFLSNLNALNHLKK